MKWTVLSDNRTNDSQLFTEHGLSILLETERHRILLDTGASDVIIRNADLLGIDLSTVDYVFISHGHSDHAGGIQYFLKMNRQAKVIVSPDAMSGNFYSKRGNLHSITTAWPESIKDRLITVEKTNEIADGLACVMSRNNTAYRWLCTLLIALAQHLVIDAFGQSLDTFLFGFRLQPILVGLYVFSFCHKY